jgi:hypothetical protein
MSVAGFNIELSNNQFVPNSSGGSIELVSDQFTPNTVGIGFDHLIDLVVSVEDLLGDPILNPTFTVTNSLGNDSVNTKDVLLLSVGQSDTLDISAVATGFQSNSISVSFVDGSPQRLVIQLSEIPKILFTCTTTFKNSLGVTIDRPISTGFIEVVFTGNGAYDKDDFIPTFEAIPFLGSKYGSTILGFEVLSETLSSISYKVDIVPESGDFCYLSNYIKKQC